MLKRFLLLPCLLLAVPGFAQTAPGVVEMAGLQEEVRGLSQRVADLSLRVEQLESEIAKNRDRPKPIDQNFATVPQLNEAVATLNRAIQSLANEAKAPAPQAVAAKKSSPSGSFSDDFPKTGLNYTVQKGETLALIAKKTGAKISDIINANKIAEPSRIQAGQALFIPGGK